MHAVLKCLNVQSTGSSLSETKDGEHPFGDHFVGSSRSLLNGTFYAESIANSDGGDCDDGNHSLHEGVHRLVKPHKQNDAHEHHTKGNGRLDDE